MESRQASRMHVQTAMGSYAWQWKSAVTQGFPTTKTRAGTCSCFGVHACKVGAGWLVATLFPSKDVYIVHPAHMSQLKCSFIPPYTSRSSLNTVTDTR
jgi:hypothetical protein